MFNIYQSNRLETLMAILDDRLAEADRNKAAFEPNTILIQSYGMGQWIKLQLAEARGVSGNVDCVLPPMMVWRLYGQLLQDEDIPQVSSFDVGLMTWNIMQLLVDIDNDMSMGPLRDYMRSDIHEQLRRYQLGQRIANNFDQYMVFRPEWIAAWDVGKRPVEIANPACHEWQRNLWQQLVSKVRGEAIHSPLHRVALQQKLIEALDGLDQLPEEIPSHFSLFGLSSLAPQYLQILTSLSRLCEVDLYFLNPCQHYWGDILPAKTIARADTTAIIQDSPNTVDYMAIGNPLLSSFGKHGRDFSDLLLEVEAASFSEDFTDPLDDSPSLLHQVQHNILELQEPGERTPTIDESDRSIQIHSCHSRMREIEVLHDQILGFFQRGNLEPRDILVMMPDVTKYAPFIEAVFSAADIPHAISDQTPYSASPFVSILFDLLALPSSRLTATSVMDFLEMPSIARKFGIADDELSIIGHWIKASGIRWAMDGTSKEAVWDLPPVHHNTWQFGFDRMLLGLSIGSENGLLGDLLPFDDSSNQAELVGKLIDFVKTLWRFQGLLGQGNTMSGWRGLLQEIIVTLFDPTTAEELDLHVLRNALQLLQEETAASFFDERIEPELFRHWLQEKLNKPVRHQTFLTGGITFATLLPMRSIPFKVICLVGMNDKEYPRQITPSSFDLMAMSPARKGDRTRRDDDRYLFLEAILAAREILYISYIGRGIRDNKSRLPSVLVSELVEYCEAACRCHEQAVADVMMTDHPLQPFDPAYFMADSKVRSFARQWYSEPAEPRPFVSQPLTPRQAEVIDLHEFARFFQHPCRHFMQRILGVYFRDNIIHFEDSEPFQVDPLLRYQLAETALQSQLAGIDFSDWQKTMMASGQLSPDSLGEVHLSGPWQRAEEIYQLVHDVLAQEPERKDVRISAGGYRIAGEIATVFGNSQLFYRTGQIRARQLVYYWTLHLCLNTQNDISTLLISNERNYRFPPLPADQAEQSIIALTQLYLSGHTKPLPLIPEISLLWQRSARRGTDEATTIKRCHKAWSGEYGEGRDPYYARVFTMPSSLDSRFRDTAAAVLDPMLDVMEQPK